MTFRENYECFLPVTVHVRHLQILVSLFFLTESYFQHEFTNILNFRKAPSSEKKYMVCENKNSIQDTALLFLQTYEESWFVPTHHQNFDKHDFCKCLLFVKEKNTGIIIAFYFLLTFFFTFKNSGMYLPRATANFVNARPKHCLKHSDTRGWYFIF